MTERWTRSAIVTGASHGIGAAVAERLALDGLAVVVNYSSGSDEAAALVAKIQAAGGTAIAVKADVADPAAVKALFDAAEQAATKAGIEAMTHIVAKELGGREISVNAIAPGPVDTPLFTADKTPEQIEAARKMNPFGRLGEPDDIARVVSFLVGPDGGWVSGQVLRANGGVV